LQFHGSNAVVLLSSLWLLVLLGINCKFPPFAGRTPLPVRSFPLSRPFQIYFPSFSFQHCSHDRGLIHLLTGSRWKEGLGLVVRISAPFGENRHNPCFPQCAFPGPPLAGIPLQFHFCPSILPPPPTINSCAWPAGETLLFVSQSHPARSLWGGPSTAFLTSPSGDDPLFQPFFPPGRKAPFFSVPQVTQKAQPELNHFAALTGIPLFRKESFLSLYTLFLGLFPKG